MGLVDWMGRLGYFSCIMRYLGFGVLALLFVGIALATYFSPFVREPEISGLGFAHQEAIRAGIAGMIATATTSLAGYIILKFAKPKKNADRDTGG
jgi:hypothetical protein